MIVMWHKVNYKLNNQNELISHMVYIAKDSQFTAMSDTVGFH